MRYLIRTIPVAAALAAMAFAAAAQSADTKPPFASYRKVAIGMKTDEARKVLGDPRDKGDEQDFYVLSDDETMQLVYDKDRNITAISITYYGDLSKAPTPKAVLGEELSPKADGSIFKMVRYPKSGFWVSYSKTAGESAVVSITLQKI